LFACKIEVVCVEAVVPLGLHHLQEIWPRAAADAVRAEAGERQGNPVVVDVDPEAVSRRRLLKACLAELELIEDVCREWDEVHLVVVGV
jgi:hypothetical protein